MAACCKRRCPLVAGRSCVSATLRTGTKSNPSPSARPAWKSTNSARRRCNTISTTECSARFAIASARFSGRFSRMSISIAGKPVARPGGRNSPPSSRRAGATTSPSGSPPSPAASWAISTRPSVSSGTTAAPFRTSSTKTSTGRSGKSSIATACCLKPKPPASECRFPSTNSKASAWSTSRRANSGSAANSTPATRLMPRADRTTPRNRLAPRIPTGSRSSPARHSPRSARMTVGRNTRSA